MRIQNNTVNVAIFVKMYCVIIGKVSSKNEH